MVKLTCKVNEVPSWGSILLYGLQQALICVPGLILTPQLMADAVCAGSAAATLKADLMASVFIATGFATFLQTTLGLRLPVMHGPAAAFLPPIYAYAAGINCQAGENDHVPEEEWLGRLQEVAGSLMFACLFFIVIGVTGLAGLLSRLIGPITIVPVMLLLCISLIPIMQEMMSTHWISVLAIGMAAIMVIFLADYPVWIPGIGKFCLFGQYPLALTIVICWFVCYVVTLLGLEPTNSPVRYDRNQSISTMGQSRWFALPYPGQIGLPRLNIGLGLAFSASVLVDIVENLGSYDLLARVCNHVRPPKDAVNRAIAVEGISSMLGASMGVGLGLTTYSNNIALIQITKVASRAPMQCAGIILVVLGIVTKAAAFLATIPDAIIGGMMIVVVGMIAGVSLSNLQLVDLSISRNISIMGFACMAGIAFPLHFEKFPLKTGYPQLDEMINMLIGIKMLVGGFIAVVLDNTVPGASIEQRGLHQHVINEKSEEVLETSGYAFPRWFTRITSRIPIFRVLPFMPVLNIHEHNKTSLTVNTSMYADKI